MSRPALLAVEDNPHDLELLELELVKRYGEDYQVVCLSGLAGALGALDELAESSTEVALVLADFGGAGVEVLAQARARHRRARCVALVGWGQSAAAIHEAAGSGRIDDWITKPVGPGDEHFHQGVGRFLYEWSRGHRPGFEAVRVVGPRWSARSHEIRDVLSRNSVLFGFLDAESDEGQALLDRLGRPRLPVVVTFDGRVLEDPTNAEIAGALGIRTRPPSASYDVIVIGAGPAGLAAAVYAASEGLRTLLLEREAIGGQAGTSSSIRNYLGFPRGISGTELAVRAFEQAGIFGSDIVYGEAVGVEEQAQDYMVKLRDAGTVTSRAVVIATGVSYRRLGIPALDAYTGSGVFYGAAASEAKAMQGRPVHVVGGANSAGQAALHLAGHAAHVTLVVRRTTLTETMSDYLVRAIQAAPNVTVRYRTEVIDGSGDGQLTTLTLRDRSTGAIETAATGGLFLLIGAEPHTSWLPASIQRDDRGYLVTGADLLAAPQLSVPWHLPRPPLPFETSLPGVFAVGDVRHGGVKRVAAAVGDGSVAIRLLHEYLTQAGRPQSA